MIASRFFRTVMPMRNRAGIVRRFRVTHVAMALMLVGSASLFVVSPSSLDAQEPRPILGTVIEESTQLPLEGALLTLLDDQDRDTGVQAVTAADGRFSFTAPGAGIYAIQVRRLGFGITFTPQFEVPETGPVTVSVLMTSEPIALEDLTIGGTQIDWVRRGFLEDFYSRVETGNGRYLTRDDMKRYPASTFTDLVHLIPGFSTKRVGNQDLIVSRRGSMSERRDLIRGDFSRMGAADGVQAAALEESIEKGERDFDLANPCPVVFYLDGRPLNPGNNPSYASVEMAYMLDAEDIEGVEFYAGPSSIPGQFTGADAGCGVVVVWTRRSSFSSAGRGGGTP